MEWMIPKHFWIKIEQIIFELFSFSSHNNKAKLKVCLDILKEDITRAFNSKNFWGNSKSTSKNVFFISWQI